MSILVVQLSARPRVRARAPGQAERDDLSSVGEFDYVVTTDGLDLQAQGRSAPVLLPKAASVVAVVGDADVGWHRITLPKANAARMREALVGLMEDALLDEDSHLALEPDAVPGQPAWVAAVHRPWLAAQLRTLEKARVFVDRVVPSSWPDTPGRGHFSEAESDPTGDPATATLSWADMEGVVFLRLQGGLARKLLPNPLPEGARWTATPAATATGSAWLGAPVTVMTPSQRALQATRSTWNLRQFELAPKHRGARLLRDAWRRFRSPEWRPARLGAITLIALQVVGLNLYAWQQRSTLDRRQLAMTELLRTTHPQVRAVLDAPIQMRRETDALRAAAGRASDDDFEPLLQAAALAWPANRPAVDSLRYEPGHLTLSAAGWSTEEIDQFRGRLRPAGWVVESLEGRLVISRGNAETRRADRGSTPATASLAGRTDGT